MKQIYMLGTKTNVLLTGLPNDVVIEPIDVGGVFSDIGDTTKTD